MEVFFLISLTILAAYLALLAWYARGWRQLRVFRLGKTARPIRVTIIVPARDEAANIQRCLDGLVLQDYPRHLLEIIVVDDFSTDDTATIVKRYAPDVKLLSLADAISEKDTNSFKKKGIELAVQAATGELLVTTDADCAAGPGWITALVAFYEKTGAVFIAAPVKLNARNRFVEVFQALDFLSLQGITAGSVQLNFHAMCNGANLAYTKAAFEAVNGFAGIDAIASGDDMLLMYKMYRQFPANIRYLKHRNAVVTTAAMPNWRSFFNQRIRWASKASHYQDKRVFWALLVVYLLNVAALTMMVGVFLMPQHARWVILFLLVKCLAELGFLLPVAGFFGVRRLLWWFPLCQPFHILYTVMAGFLGKFGTYRWKGREVR